MTEAEDHLTGTEPGDPPAAAPRSRRSLITGAAAAIGALAAQAVVLPSPASAAGVVLGGANNTTTPTIIQDNAAGAGAKALVGRTTSAASTTSIGVQGESLGGSGIGVYGTANNGTSARGVLGRSTSGTGVRGESTGNIGVYASGGYAAVYTAGTGPYGVVGNGSSVGVQGQGTAYGVYGVATGSTGVTYAVYGNAFSPAGYAGYFDGPVAVTGTLTKPAGSFKIDHPLDPERRWLSHSFVESPDMKNIYDGVATAGANGTVTVRLPSYFEALNRTFRYQLTALDGPAPSLHIARRISKRSFRIGGAAAGQEISWMVTGIRQDDYANAHRINVDSRKTRKDRGTRLFVPKGSGARRMDHSPVEPKHHKLAKPKAPRPG